MTTDIISVEPLMLMTKVAEIFESNTFHHIPVVDNGKPVGIISKHDYYMLLGSRTKLKMEDFEKFNKRWLQALTVRDVMTVNPLCLNPDDLMLSTLDVFLENRHHAILICEKEKLVGIITPFDLLRILKSAVVVV